MAGTALPARPRADTPEAATLDASSARGLVWLAVVALVVGGCAAYGLYLARQALLIIYLGALLAIGLAPLVRGLERRGLWPRARGLPRWGAVTIVYLIAGGLGLLALVLVLPTLVGQSQAFARYIPDLLHDGQRWLIARGLLVRELSVQEVVREAPAGGDAFATVVGGLWALFGGVVGLVTILVLSFYFLIETDDIFAAFIRLFPRHRRARVRAVAQEITLKVSGWLNGQMSVAAIIGGTAALGLGLLGVPYFYVLALIAAVGELIPYLGPIVAAVPAVTIAATVSWQLAVATLVFFVLQQQLENNVVVPRLMSAHVGLSPVAVMIAVLLGASLFGLVGIILAVPTAAIAQVLFHELVPAAEE